MKAHTQLTQTDMTPEEALAFLEEGNQRFKSNSKLNRNLMQQVNETHDGQFPFAVILSCIDSRVSSELIFDQGLGDIFSIRIAGNFVNEDILGSMEFACKVAGSKLIVVMGHTQCGAIKGACDGVELGNLTSLLSKLKPAVDSVTAPDENRSSKNSTFVQDVAEMNIGLTIAQIKDQSPVLNEMIESGQVAIVGAMYDVKTGETAFRV